MSSICKSLVMVTSLCLFAVTAAVYFMWRGAGSAPDRIRLFVNEPNLSFEDVEDATPAQSTSLSEQDPATEGDNVFKIQLKATK